MRRTISSILASCMMASLLAGCDAPTLAASAPEETADLVVFGTIYTAEDENDGLAEAFAVKDGKYIYVGDRQGAELFVEEGKTEVLDRTGEGLIIPGCTEGHSHYFGIYGVQSQLPCANCSYAAMLDTLKEQVASGDIAQFGTFGWNGAELRDRREAGDNFAEELESIAPGIPVVLIDNTGHNAVCNTTALIKSGLIENPEVRGGEVWLDKEGKPSGYVSDQAVGFVFENSIDNILNEEQFQKACIIAQDMLLPMGYTNAFDAYLNQFDETSAYEALKTLDDEGELKMNVAASYNIKSCDADIYKEKVDRVSEIAETNKSKHFKPEYIKLFADGVTEEGTGWLFNEYENAPEGKEHGNIIWEPEELKDIVTYANSKGLLIHTHSYGDAACKAMLDACIASNEANGGEYRNCLGHVRNIQKEDVIRAAENKIPVAANLIWHADYDDDNPDQLKVKNALIKTMSEDIYYSGYPMKSLVESGVVVSSSTDAPAAMSVEGTAMNVLEVAVTGKQPNDSAKAFAEDELLTVREGLQALTINGAWQLGLEEERGSIKEGKFADFVILDKNILEYGKDQYNKIGDTKVLSTYFEGEKVYSAQESALTSQSGQEPTAKEKIMALYGENKEIAGPYDESLAVKCINGTFVGKKEGDVLMFKGIPFVGEQPVGENALKAPIPFKEDNGVYEAYYFGKTSIQAEGVFEEASLYCQGEDSLKLNIWTNTKDQSTDKPVLVYIHGGAFDAGGTVDPLYDGYNFVNANPDAILVTITYRLNYRGFIDLSAFDDFEGSPDETPYNFGLLDQVEALRWINANIENFGGDKDKITIFGQSAGAMSVAYLCCIEEARNFFKNAIIMSPMGIDNSTKATLHTMTENLKKALNISTIEELKKVEPEKINEIAGILAFKCGPATDDRTMFKKDLCSIFEDIGREGKINIIQGFTKDESHYLISACGGPEPFADTFEPLVLSRIAAVSPEDTQYMVKYYNSREGHYYDKLADMLDQMTFFPGSFKIANSYAKGAAESENGGSIYSYLFRVESSEPYIRAGHSVELPGLFGNPCKMLCGRTFDEKLGTLMQRMWINFAKTGNPSVTAEESPYGEAFDWTEYTQKENAAAIFDEFETHMDTYKNIGLVDERIHSILNNGKSLWGE